MEVPQAVDDLLVPIRAYPYFLQSESAHDFHDDYTSNGTYACSMYLSADLHSLPTTNDSVGDRSLGFNGVSGVRSYGGFANSQCVLSPPPAYPAYLPRPDFISDSHQSSLDSRYASNFWSATNNIIDHTSCDNYASFCERDHGSLDIPMLEPRCEVLSALPTGLLSTSAVRSRLRNNADYDLILGEVAAMGTGGESDYSYYGVSKAQPQPQGPKVALPLHRPGGRHLCFVKSCIYKGSFSRKADLRRHMNIHFPPPPEERFGCRFANCERRGLKGFIRRDKLLQHQRKEHRGL